MTFQDGLGYRMRLPDRAGGEALEILYLKSELTILPSFEFALRERVARLANFHHAYFGRVRRVDRAPGGGLAVVFEHVAGMRLSDILKVAERQQLALETTAALCLLRQLLPAVALLHENAREVAHGALGPHRIVMTPLGRPVVVEHVFGAAFEQLQLSRERFWRELQVAVPPSAGPARLDQRTDVAQIGMVALALVLGRLIRRDEYPDRLRSLIGEATERFAAGERRPLSPVLQTWLVRALQLDPRRAFESAREAYAALEDDVLGEAGGYMASPVALEAFLSRCVAGPGFQSDGRPPSEHPKTSVERKELDEVRRESTGSEEAPQTATAPETADPGHGSAPPLRSVPAPSTSAARPEQAGGGSEIAEIIAGQSLNLTASPVEEGSMPEASARRGRATSTQKTRRGGYSVFSLPRRLGWRRTAVLALALIALGQGAFLGARALQQSALPVDLASVVVESQPPGVPIFVDGVERGTTPARLSVEAGAHILELRGSGPPRVFPLSVTAGAQISKYVELTETPVTGTLEVSTDPSGAEVSIDGERRGVSPIAVGDLTPGEHLVTVAAQGRSVSRVILIEPGGSSSLVVPLVPSGVPVSGWLEVAAPLEMEVFEQGRLLGSTHTERIMVAAGRHELEIVNQVVGYRGRRVVEVAPGKVARVAIELPRGVLHINALPWADVWIDGQQVGATPLGNLEVPVGPHEILFRHPEFGERRHAVTVTLHEPTRVSLDFRR